MGLKWVEAKSVGGDDDWGRVDWVKFEVGFGEDGEVDVFVAGNRVGQNGEVGEELDPRGGRRRSRGRRGDWLWCG